MVGRGVSIPTLTYSWAEDHENQNHMQRHRGHISREKRQKGLSYLFPITLRYPPPKLRNQKDRYTSRVVRLVLLSHISFQCTSKRRLRRKYGILRTCRARG